MGSIQDSPVFAKSMGALLILMAMIDILITYINSDFTGLTGDDLSRNFVNLLWYSVITVSFILLVYGTVAGNWKFWLLALALLVLRMVYHAYSNTGNIPLLILDVISIIVMFYPRFFKYEFRDYFAKKAELKKEE